MEDYSPTLLAALAALAARSTSPRIKELAYRASSKRWNEALENYHYTLDMERFAALLIHECGAALDPLPSDEAEIIGRIKKHFGVE
jgi:hypothetical protein